MIKINLRRDNKIITLSVDMKGAILSRNGSFNFYNSMELLCIAVGACFANEFWKYCYLEEINIDKFEEIFVTMDNHNIIINVKHPSDLNDKIKEKIKFIVNNCEVGKKLIDKPICNLIPSNKKLDEIEDKIPEGCCGG